jgi:hypothetical protein
MDEVLNTALVWDDASRERPAKPRAAERAEQEPVAVEEAVPVAA